MVEGVVAELGVAADEGPDLGHHVSPLNCPLTVNRDRLDAVAVTVNLLPVKP